MNLRLRDAVYFDVSTKYLNNNSNNSIEINSVCY
jgi:hypothetical protein